MVKKMDDLKKPNAASWEKQQTFASPYSLTGRSLALDCSVLICLSATCFWPT